jgi:hypothetical protein
LKDYDATFLIKKYNAKNCKILIDQGDEDTFLKANQLLPQNLVEGSKQNELVAINLRMQKVK